MSRVKSEEILDIAFDLFSTRGIYSVSMADIADKAKIDISTLYSYFETKEILAVKTATLAWSERVDDVLPSLLKSKYQNANGYTQLEQIFALFVKLYETQTEFLRFIYLFDSFAVREKIPREMMVNYEIGILKVKQIISEAIQKGINDGSINSTYSKSGDLLYFTLMHTFFSAAQKLALSGKMLDMDSQMNGSAQLKLLAQLLLDSLKGN